MRAQRERVHLSTAHVPPLGDHLGAEALRDEVVALEQLWRERLSPLLLGTFIDLEADAPHVLYSAGDDQVVDPGRDAQGPEMHRLLSGPAADVDGRGTRGFGK